jgi:hypothetical protein
MATSAMQQAFGLRMPCKPLLELPAGCQLRDAAADYLHFQQTGSPRGCVLR